MTGWDHVSTTASREPDLAADLDLSIGVKRVKRVGRSPNQGPQSMSRVLSEDSLDEEEVEQDGNKHLANGKHNPSPQWNSRYPFSDGKPA